MTGIKINREVNLYSIITTVVAAIGLLVTGASWTNKIESRVDKADASIIRLEAVDIKLMSQIDTARDLATGRQEAIMRELATLNSRQSRIEAILERVDRAGRQ